MNRYPLSILTVLSTNIATLSLVCLAHFVIAAAHGIPHSWVFWSGKYCPTIVVKRIIIHVLQLVGLTKSIPSSEILRIDLHSVSIGFDGSRNVLHFQILMPHESPSSKTSSIKFEGLPEVDDGFKVFSHERVVISDNTAGLGVVFVIIKLFEC